MNDTTKIYIRQMVIGIALFVIFLVIALLNTQLTPWFNRNNWDNIIMFLPIFPGIYAGLNLARAVMTMDELQQRIQLEAFTFSLANTAFVALALGLFQASNEFSINFVWVIPIMAGFWGIGLWMARRKFQ